MTDTLEHKRGMLLWLGGVVIVFGHAVKHNQEAVGGVGLVAHIC